MLVLKTRGKNNHYIHQIRNNSNHLVTSFVLTDGYNEETINTNLYPNHEIVIKSEINYDTISDFKEEMITESKKVLDLTSGSIKKKMIIFALPIFFSSLLQTLYNLIDSLIVGRFIGKEALAAVSTSGNLIYLFTSFFLGASQGAGILIAKYFGAKRFRQMSKTIHNNIAFGFLASILLTIIGVLFTPTMLKWMNTAPNVLPNSISYFRYYFIGCTGIIMYNILSQTLNSVGNSRMPLYYLIISSILNVILDLFLIGLLGLHEVKYAAIATTISQFLSATLCFIYLIRVKTAYKFSFRRLELDFNKIKEILYYGIPTGIQNSVIGLANVLVQSNINTFGDNAMAGYGAYVKLENFVFTPINAFSMAISTFIGQNLGAKDYQRAKKGARFGILGAVILAAIFGVFFFIFSPNLIALFNGDHEVVKYGVTHARITALFFGFLAFSHAVAALCRGSGKPIVAMSVMLAIWCVFRVAYIYLALYLNNQFYMLSIAYPLTWIISSIIYLIYYLKADWIHNFERRNERQLSED